MPTSEWKLMTSVICFQIRHVLPLKISDNFILKFKMSDLEKKIHFINWLFVCLRLLSLFKCTDIISTCFTHVKQIFSLHLRTLCPASFSLYESVCFIRVTEIYREGPEISSFPPGCRAFLFYNIFVFYAFIFLFFFFIFFFIKMLSVIDDTFSIISFLFSCVMKNWFLSSILNCSWQFIIFLFLPQKKKKLFFRGY